VYAVNPIPVKRSSVAADRAFIGSAPRHASTAATASTAVTMHRVTVCTVPTARAEPAMAAASTHRLARVIGVVGPPVPWLPVVGIARLGGYLRLSVAAEVPGVRNSPAHRGSFPSSAPRSRLSWDSRLLSLDTLPTRQARGSPWSPTQARPLRRTMT